MTIYGGLIQFCVWTTVLLSAAFALLVLRRWLTERRAPFYKARQQAITRNYLQRVGGFQQDDVDRWTVRERLSAVEHLLLLLRGGDRDRLIQLAEIDGLLDAVLRRANAWRAARRIDSIRILQQFGGESAIAKLRESLGHDRHRIVRLNAAFALASFGRLPPPRETIDMLGMPTRAPTRLDVAILRAMAPDYSDHLERLLDEQMPLDRRAAIVDALGWSGHHSVLPTLESASTFDNAEIRCAALRAAAKVGHPSVAPWVTRALDDTDSYVRIQAANSCAALGLKGAIPALRVLTHDPELWVRLRAAEALTKLRPKSAARQSA